MTMQEQDPGRQLGYLEGRMEEQAIALRDLKAGQQELRAEVRSDIAEVRAGLQELRAEVRSDIAEVRAGLQELRAEVRSDIADVRTGQR